MKFCMQIVCTIMLLVAFVGGILTIWSCKTEDYCPPLNACKNATKNILDCSTDIALVRKGEQSYAVYQYESLDKAFLCAQNGDVIYVFNRDIKISEKALNVLYAKRGDIKNIEIRFANETSLNTIKIKP